MIIHVAVVVLRHRVESSQRKMEETFGRYFCGNSAVRDKLDLKANSSDNFSRSLAHVCDQQNNNNISLASPSLPRTSKRAIDMMIVKVQSLRSTRVLFQDRAPNQENKLKESNLLACLPILTFLLLPPLIIWLSRVLESKDLRLRLRQRRLSPPVFGRVYLFAKANFISCSLPFFS